MYAVVMVAKWIYHFFRPPLPSVQNDAQSGKENDFDAANIPPTESTALDDCSSGS